MTIFDLLDRLAFMRGAPAAALVLVVAFLALVLWDFRPAVLALGLAYLAGGLLFVDLLDPRLAVVYTLSGIFVTLMMAVTARQINWGRPPDALTPADQAALGTGRRVRLGPLDVPAYTPLRAMALAIALAAAFWLWRGESDLLVIVPAEQDSIRLAVIGLLALGLAGMATSPEPFPAGLGLLVFLLGFALYMSVVEQSIDMAIALVALNLLIALAISYLAQARFIPVDVVD